LSVVEPSNLHLPGGGSRRVDQERDRLETGVRDIVQRAKVAGVRATHLVWEGDPAGAILDAAIAEGADVIVLGSRRRTSLRRILLGSVSAEVSRAATCRVVVVAA
jgi:nucleotide-binding universal stress UspA family protein